MPYYNFPHTLEALNKCGTHKHGVLSHSVALYIHVPLSARTGSLSVLSPDEFMLHSAPQLAESPTHPWPLVPAAVCVRVSRGFVCTWNVALLSFL